MKSELPDLTPPDGFVYQWNVVAVKGELTPQRDYGASGWEPVPQAWHPDDPVEVHGLRLMVMSERLHAELRERLTARALGQNEDAVVSHFAARLDPIFRVVVPSAADETDWVTIWRSEEDD